MDDVGALLADHGVDDFIAVGWSGGGSRAVASAALFPGRCRAAAAIAVLGPYGVEDLDWYAGMSRPMQDLYRAAANEPAAHAEVVATMGAEYGELTVDGMRAMMASMGEPELDIQLAQTDMAGYFVEQMRRAQIQGPEGWRCDDHTLISPWGFDCESITVPLAVWYGGQDDTCPAVHSEWLIAHTPTAVGRFCEDDGHLSIGRHLGDILDDLRQLAGLAS
jgi:pimeloyl-ACP methyl ester carboxylesterase